MIPYQECMKEETSTGSWIWDPNSKLQLWAKSIQEYFTRVSQFKEKLEEIEYKINEDELVMTALNGLTRSLHSYIQTIFVRKESLQFEILWEECVQEEAIVGNWEVLLRDDDHALATHTIRKGKHHFKKETHKGSYPPKKFQKNKKWDYKQKYFSFYQCYHCDNIGHISRNYTTKKE